MNLNFRVYILPRFKIMLDVRRTVMGKKRK